MAVRDDKLADAIVRAMLVVDPYLILFAPANSALERAGEAAELRVMREVFADRNYLGRWFACSEGSAGCAVRRARRSGQARFTHVA